MSKKTLEVIKESLKKEDLKESARGSFYAAGTGAYAAELHEKIEAIRDECRRVGEFRAAADFCAMTEHICSMNSLNDNSIWSYLLKRTAELVDVYAGDLFCDWNTVHSFISPANLGMSRDFWIGIRNMGVDGTLFVENRISDPNAYLELYLLEVSLSDEGEIVENLYLVPAKGVNG